MNDVLALDNLERAEAMLDQIDDAQERLEADMARSARLSTALAVAADASDAVPNIAAAIDLLRYVAELEASEDADLIAVAALLREEVSEDIDASAMTRDAVVQCLGRLGVKNEIARLGVLDANAFSKTLGNEVTRHIRVQDSLALFVVEHEERLEPEEELRLIRALRELAINPGEVVGRIGENGYGVVIPWLEPRQAHNLAGTFDALVRGALPDRTASIGMNAGIPDAGAGATRFAWPTLTPQTRPMNGRGRSK